MPKARICLLPRVSGVGGMVTFAEKFTNGMATRGISVTHEISASTDAVLIIGGTRQLLPLWQAHQKGIRLVQRLDGMNWLHRLPQNHPRNAQGWRHFLRAEYGNWLLSLIRKRLAERVVYQSRFVQSWWERVRGPTPAASKVVHNGVDLHIYSPAVNQAPPDDRYRLLMVEGSLLGGYEQGLATGVQLAQTIAAVLKDARSRLPQKPLELQVVGRVPPQLRHRYASLADCSIEWVGTLPAERIPDFDRQAHLLFSADIHPACPNAVIEALACGLPVLAFDTGSIPELVSADVGRVVPYGGDPWQLDPPDIPSLASAALDLLADQPHFRQAARQKAAQEFGLERMLDRYLDVLLG